MVSQTSIWHACSCLDHSAARVHVLDMTHSITVCSVGCSCPRSSAKPSCKQAKPAQEVFGSCLWSLADSVLPCAVQSPPAGSRSSGAHFPTVLSGRVVCTSVVVSAGSTYADQISKCASVEIQSRVLSIVYIMYTPYSLRTTVYYAS